MAEVTGAALVSERLLIKRIQATAKRMRPKGANFKQHCMACALISWAFITQNLQKIQVLARSAKALC